MTMRNQNPLSETESNCKNIYNEGKFMLENSGWVWLAADDSKPEDCFLFVKRSNDEVLSGVKISWHWAETFSLVSSRGPERTGETSLLWFHVALMSSPDCVVGHLWSCLTLWGKPLEPSSIHSTLPKYLFHGSPPEHLLCARPCVRTCGRDV